MQRQPCQQQQGASLLQDRPPAPSTLLGGIAPAGDSGSEIPPPGALPPVVSLPDFAHDWFKPSEGDKRPPHWIAVEKKASDIYNILPDACPKTYPKTGFRFQVIPFATDILYPKDRLNSEGVDMFDKQNNVVALNGKWLDFVMRTSPDDYHIDVATAIAHGARHLTQSWPSWIANKSADSPVRQKLDDDAVKDVKQIRPRFDALWAAGLN